MSETETLAPDEQWAGPVGDAFGGQVSQSAVAERDMPLAMAMPIGGPNSATDLATAGVITAQRVAVKRRLTDIRKDAIIEAQAAGDVFFYRIPFKNRRKGTTEWAEGPTIQCAMAAANLYGNCRVEAFVQAETPEAFIFLARFTDLEKGVTITRSFRQRRSMDTGMGDNERRQEMIFSIGQSKAMRNVTVAALGWLTDLMEKEAKKGILNKIEGNPDAARKQLYGIVQGLDIPLARVERSIGRKIGDWLAPEMARLFGQLASVRDGFAHPDDLFPAPEVLDAEVVDAAAMTNAAATAKPAQKKEAAAKPARVEKKEAPTAPAAEAKPAMPTTEEVAAANTAQHAAEPATEAPAQAQQREPEPPAQQTQARTTSDLPEDPPTADEDGNQEGLSFG